MRKHLVSIALLAFLLPPFSAFAETETVNGVSWTFTVANGEASVENGWSSAIPTTTTGSISIPSELGGYAVTSIGNAAFYSCSGLTSITIPDGVTRIGDYAFSGCSGLTSATIPDSMTSIGEDAFEECSENLFDTTCIPGVKLVDGWAVDHDNALSGVLDLTGIRGIADGAFSAPFLGVSKLTAVTIPHGVTSIGNGAFSCCDKLMSITIPDSVTWIGESAFWGCAELTSITIPNNVTSIGNYAFEGCSGLMTIAIPNGVTNIAHGLFGNCTGLTSITIPDSVTSIGYDAFIGCTGLTSVAIPSGVTSIGGGAFQNCCGLTSIVIPDGVAKIESYTFMNCSSLSSVVIPDSVTSIGERALFAYGSELAEIHITDLVAWCGISFASYPFNGSAYRLFLNGEEIVDLVIPTGVTSIGEFAFESCSGLMSVTIPDSVTNIARDAFGGCSGLTSVTIPDSVTRIEEWAFVGCSGLETILVSPDNPVYDSRDDCNAIVETATGRLISGCKNTVIPEGVTSVSDGSFAGCSGLATIIIPDGVTSLGDSAFSGCSGLSSILLPNSLTSIGWDAFSDCTALTTIVIPGHVTSIGFRAFENCDGLTSIYLPRTVDVSVSSLALPDSCEVVFYAPDSVLTVVSEHGTPLPGRGETQFEGAEIVSASVRAPAAADGVRYACTGWTGTGSVPASGAETNVAFRILENSTIEWNWETNYWLDLTVSGGTSDFNSSWMRAGEIAVIHLAPATGYAIVLSGDTNGVLLAGTTLSVPMDRPRSVSVTITDGTVYLDVSSEIGQPEPEVGRHAFFQGQSVSSGVRSPVEEGGTRFVCTGWTGTGSVPASGTETDVTFAITENSSVSWLWEESEYRIDVAYSVNDGSDHRWSNWFSSHDGYGSCDLEIDQDVFDYELESTYWGEDECYVYGLGADEDPSSSYVWFPVRGPASIWIHLYSAKPAIAPGGSPLVWKKANDDSWRPVADASLSDGSCLRSGEIDASETSSIAATASGPGTLSFKWRISANRGDFCRFYVDGVEAGSIQRTQDWTTCSAGISSGTHEFKWVFERGSLSAAGEDAAFLDDVDWRPDVTLTVSSALGTPSPAVGTHSLGYGNEVTASITEPASADGVRHVCTGWTGTGSVPANGSGTTAAFTITNDSTIAWNWRTDYWIDLSVSGGTTDFEPRWVASGQTVTAEIVPATHLYSISLSGDTTGVTVSGTRLTVPANRARTIRVTVIEKKLSLQVSSVLGEPVPATGAHSLSWGTVVEARMREPVPADGERWVCTGWTGTGSVPASGTGTNCTFTIDAGSSLTWNWKNQYLIELETDGPISTDFLSGWGDSGSVLTVCWEASVPYVSLSLSGDTDGVSLDEATRRLSIPVDRARTISFSARELSLRSALDAENLSWSTDGDAEWFPQLAVSADGDDAVQSGAVVGDDISGLQTRVSGPGTFGWTWKIENSGRAGVDVILDGSWLSSYVPGADWTDETLEISGEGLHTIRFEYWNAGTAGAIGDRAYLDRATWTEADPLGEVTVADVEQHDAVLVVPIVSLDPSSGSATLSATVTASADGHVASTVSTNVDAPGTISVPVSGLDAGCNYEYSVEFRLSNGTAFSESGSFRTLGGIGPTGEILVHPPGAVAADATVRLISSGDRYQTAVRGRVEFSTAAANSFDQSIAVEVPWTGPGGKEVKIPGLTRLTDYVARAVFTSEPDGLCATSSVVSFRTEWGETPRIAAGRSGDAWLPALSFGSREDGNGEDFLVRIENPVPGCYYPVYTNGTPAGCFAVQSCGTPERAEGGYVVRVPADADVKFVKIGVSKNRLHPGTIEGQTPVFTVSFDSEGGSAVTSITAPYGSALVEPAAPTMAGHDFAGWIPAFPATMPEGGATLTAQWTPKNYTITFDSAEGSAVASITAAYGAAVTAPTAPTKEGYTFDGWSPIFPSTMPLGGMTLTAQWTPKNYTITFNSAGGSAVASITAPYGSAIVAPAAPTMESHIFAGWLPSFPETMPLGGATLTAQWMFADETNYNWTVSGNSVKISGVKQNPTGAVVISAEIGGYSVTEIGNSAFANCTKMTSITIPASVTSINSSAFKGCSGLTEVHISDLKVWCGISFGSYDANPCYYSQRLFLNGEEITDLVIPDGTKTIKNYAFRNCTRLSSITIPSSVTSIGVRAFERCSGLTAISVSSGNTVYDSRNNCNAVIQTSSNALIAGCQNTVIPFGVVSIGFDAFHGRTRLTAIEIPDSVTSIGQDAFYGCSSLTSITIPDGVMSVGSGVFYGCSRLATISIPSSLQGKTSSWGLPTTCQIIVRN